MNHRVHVFCRACLTLKLEGSSNTVITLPSAAACPLVASVMAPSGETGVVSRGTCWLGMGVGPAEATSAMLRIGGGRSAIGVRAFGLEVLTAEGMQGGGSGLECGGEDGDAPGKLNVEERVVLVLNVV